MAQEDGVNIFGNKVSWNFIAATLIIIFIIWSVWQHRTAEPIPGHSNEKNEYETQVYVNLFPIEDNAKNYRLIADLERYYQCDGNEQNDSCWSWYNVSKITFPNAGFIEFEECQAELNKKISCTDTHEKEWYVELTDQKP